MGHHSNPSSRYKNRRNHAKRNEEFEYSKRKANIEREKKREKQEKLEKHRKKISPIFPVEYNLVNIKDNSDLYLRIPVKWTLLGRLHKYSNILLDNVLTKNAKAIFGINPKKEPHNFPPPLLRRVRLKAIWKRDITLRNVRKRWPSYNMINNHSIIFTYKHGKTWYIYIKIDVQALWESNALFYNAHTKYFELKSHVYNNYPISKFKIKGADDRCHLDIAVVDGMTSLKNRPPVTNLNNIYPMVTKSKNDKDVNCIYRVYLFPDHDIADPEIVALNLAESVVMNKGRYYFNRGLYIYAIPNVVRYKRSYNIDKLPKGYIEKDK